MAIFTMRMEPKLISSVQNPLVKKVLQLKEKSRERKKTGLFVVEGQREIELAQKGGYMLQSLLFCPEIMDSATIESFIKASNPEIIQVSEGVYNKIAHRGTTEGVLGLMLTKDHALEYISFKNKTPLVLVAEAPEKPGNIGALLRTADAAAVDAVLIANPKSDLYSPNIIRSSVGCLFTNQIGVGTTDEIITFLQTNQIKIYCAALTASKNYVDCDFKAASALVMGTEATGLTENWLKNSDQNIIIPMQGEIDSMNVSVSAAILIFEAKRQRGF
ncbi:tRNA/rRNA methyltransferase (SpoU) [Allomuricauda ruestringensis DSM 13258]|uniref:tRNA/rRNA methyltransferase (SpoU) n=1 Tax=Allomuricauda ruestringensis (strain DSM 13258 / CIP 107369 / LMG 19739 / B1) TaxID=886377 RepID=G2PS75_ALLRU|nr:RNA methyltransferase [Allomuricauda ruestringensis]AEM69332.1 tRNA/rRNA methyltransferase (SpoU) [Allomuricauda ruestringensis DSM 13258]